MMARAARLENPRMRRLHELARIAKALDGQDAPEWPPDRDVAELEVDLLRRVADGLEKRAEVPPHARG